MRIAFTNVDAAPLGRVYLRSWSNGVQGCDPAAIRVRALEGGAAHEPTQRCTTVRVDLPAPLVQGERARVAFRLSIRLPRVADRFGYAHGLSLLGSALPVLAVRDDTGWNLPPYVDLGESFYSLAGRYRVTLDTPSALATPATGVRVARRTSRDRTVQTFVARDVRDFEWAAGRLSKLTGRGGGARVAVWYPPGTTRRTAGQMLAVAERAMRTFRAAFGPYPYPELDVVLTGRTSFGGMEYPTIVFTAPNANVVAHELAHQWWYGTVGNDQFSEPWLDEGLATWSERLPTRPWRSCEGSFTWPSPTTRMTNDMAYWRDHPGQYWRVAYLGGGCMAAQLVEGFGLVRFQRVLRDLAAAHRFGVVRTEDFRAAIEAAAAIHWPAFDPDAFWRRWRMT
jgi:hypothetical protein